MSLQRLIPSSKAVAKPKVLILKERGEWKKSFFLYSWAQKGGQILTKAVGYQYRVGNFGAQVHL